MVQLYIGLGFLLAAAAPLLHRWMGDRANLVLVVYPVLAALWLISQAPDVIAGNNLVFTADWVPSLGLSLTLLLDGLALMFALLIGIVGAFVLLYAGGYLKGNPDMARFHAAFMGFMAAMFGLVLADGLVTLFVFWELTSITSYLLIGFNHQDEKSREAARQSLFVTVGGGLALMAGFVLLGIASGSWSLADIRSLETDLREHALYTPMLLCLVVGAFTKSAQFPFHFWLPNAMAAPSPVSAYLHSATMVKAGIYLLARLQPDLGDTALWTALLSLGGGVTMLLGAFMAVRYTNIKKLLAYSTIMALGTLTMLLGIGSDEALIAFAVFLVAHSLYKGSLFMVAGILDHETGTQDIQAMGGLRATMPVTAAAAMLAALSFAGLPPLLGFVGKEAMLKAVLEADVFPLLLAVLAFSAAFLTITAAAIVALRPFHGTLKATPRTPHEAPLSMLLGPSVLALLSLLLGLFVPFTGPAFSAVVTAVAGAPVEVSLSLWHGVNLPLVLTMSSLLLGIGFYLCWDGVRARLAMLTPVTHRGPQAWYYAILRAFVSLAEWQTRVLQNGYMRHYILVMLVTLAALLVNSILIRHAPGLSLAFDVRFHEVMVAATMVLGALAAPMLRSRLGAVVSVGVTGFSIALIFLLFSAPDLAITQLLVETLTVILLVLVLFRLPRFSHLSTRFERIRDGVVAAVVGGLLSLLVLIAWDVKQFTPISQYMIENSVSLAHGRNIVNVILVDYRALDTLGEMFVLSLAAIGVIAMLKLRVPPVRRSTGE